MLSVDIILCRRTDSLYSVVSLLSILLQFIKRYAAKTLFLSVCSRHNTASATDGRASGSCSAIEIPSFTHTARHIVPLCRVSRRKYFLYGCLEYKCED